MTEPESSLPCPRSVDRSLVLSATLEVRGTNGSSGNGLIDTSDSEQERTSVTLTGQKAGRDRESVNIEGRWAPLHPNGAEGGPEAYSDDEGFGNLGRVMID